MKALVLLLSIMSTVFQIDFSQKDVEGWAIINDRVMGGQSNGRIAATEEGVLFFGNVSLENNGGFTSYRSSFQQYSLEDTRTLKIRYRSDEMCMALQLDIYKRFYYPYFKVSLPISAEWTELEIPISEIEQYRMGDPTGSKLTKETLGRIIRMGLVTDEKRAGDFKLEVDYIIFE